MASDDTHKIAHRYARALFALATAAKALEAVEGNLSALKAALAQSAELSRLLSGPLLPRPQKAKLADALLAKLKAHDLTRKFIAQLATGGRLGALPAIIAEFERLMTEERGEVVLDVVTAAPTDIKALTQALTKAYGRTVQINASVDPSLIGGLVVKAGGMHMDYSIKSKLARLSRSLKTHAA